MLRLLDAYIYIGLKCITGRVKMERREKKILKFFFNKVSFYELDLRVRKKKLLLFCENQEQLQLSIKV
jgi:hypothetical protein